jgi:prepilin-type N-terminal cleavage/methylation domain-containing protein
MRLHPALRKAMTLMELVVVIGIMALLAAITIPKLIDVFERSRSGTQAYSIAEASRMIETHYGVYKKYPDGWDALTDSGGKMYSKLSPNLIGTTAVPQTFFTIHTLTDSQISSLSRVGIGHMFLHDATSLPSDSGTDRRHFGDGSGHDGTANIRTVLALDETVGSDGYRLLVDEFNMTPNNSTALLTNNVFIVVGFGPKCTAVQSVVQGAPLMEHLDPAKYYSRALAVFQVPVTSGASARFVGVFGPDGRTLKSSISDYQGGEVPH